LPAPFPPLVIIPDERPPLLLAFVFLVVIPEGNLLSLEEGVQRVPHPSSLFAKGRIWALESAEKVRFV
jgi:hypothetical protein